MILSTREKLEQYVSRLDVEYADLRYEKVARVRIVVDGSQVTEVKSSSSDGYVIRILKQGGLITVPVAGQCDIRAAIDAACRDATSLGRQQRKPVSLVLPPVVDEDVPLELDDDPRYFSLDEKITLVRNYSDLALAAPHISTTQLVYREIFRERFFVNSLGSWFSEPLVTAGILGQIEARKNSVVQQVPAHIGVRPGFHSLRTRDDFFLRQSSLAAELLDAPPVRGGNYSVVLDPAMTGLLIHEAFGHLSEADTIENNPGLREKIRIGASIGADILKIVDDPTNNGCFGCYRYDDEGVSSRAVTLMDGGIVRGRLHSMRTAARFDAPLTGHAIAEDARFGPIVRMGRIFIEPRDKSVEALIAQAGDGLFVFGAKGGKTRDGAFAVSAQGAYRIESGKRGELLRDVQLNGELCSLLRDVQAISTDIEFNEIGACGKLGQENLRSCCGGPHLLVRELSVAGNRNDSTTVSVATSLPDQSCGNPYIHRLGLLQGEQTDRQIVRAITADFFNALIAKDFIKAGALTEGMDPATIQVLADMIKPTRIVAIKEPVAQTSAPVVFFTVQCNVDVHVAGITQVASFTVKIRAIPEQPPRWAITGGL